MSTTIELLRGKLSSAPDELLERLAARLEVVVVVNNARPDLGACWLWTGAKRKGYGVIHFLGKKYSLHRLTYELAKGRPLGELEPDHLCKIISCCNPDHLEAITHAENILRQAHANRLKIHCPNNHPLSGDNLVRRKLLKGFRECRTCEIEKQRERRAKKAA